MFGQKLVFFRGKPFREEPISQKAKFLAELNDKFR